MKDIDILKDVAGVIAVYAYTLPQGVIPLVIVSKKIEWAVLQQTRDWSEGCIVLTKKDVEQGKDVFALRFLHMQAHTNLLFGKDVLKKVKIDTSSARLALESMLRVTLIDMREYILQPSFSSQVIERIALSLDRIASYTHVLDGKHKTWKNQIQACIEVCAKKECEHDDVLEIYHLLEKMTKYIDRL